MSMQDPLADALTRIRNAQMIRRADVLVPASKLISAVCDVLSHEGYIGKFEEDNSQAPRRFLRVELRYHNGEAVVRELRRVSRSGLRCYVSCADLPRVRHGLGVSVISTNRGVMSDRVARSAGLGGEVLCSVF